MPAAASKFALGEHFGIHGDYRYTFLDFSDDDDDEIGGIIGGGFIGRLLPGHKGSMWTRRALRCISELRSASPSCQLRQLRARAPECSPFSAIGGRMSSSLVAGSRPSGSSPRSASPPRPVKKIQFTDTKLKNGLRVIISEDHSAPVFAVAVNYNVGSRDERKGRTGFAHLFEHMMFKGSANVGAGEHPHLVFANGGSMNGTTNKDRTLYYEILPANQLDLALFLEADRMRSLDITKANLDNQRNAVQEERRLGVDNQPYGTHLRSARRARLRQLRLRALGHRLDGRPRAPRRVDDVAVVLQDLLRPQQRRPQHRRRRRHQGRRSRRSASTSSRFRRSRRRRRST